MRAAAPKIALKKRTIFLFIPPLSGRRGDNHRLAICTSFYVLNLLGTGFCSVGPLET